jgi:membrane protein YqaA with SNARE-associated domain
LVSGIELLSVLFFSFVLNLIPFAGPSNLFIAMNAALFVDTNPLMLGLLVAIGSASAKLVQYFVTYFLGGRLGEERRRRLDALNTKIGKWAFPALFIASATPIPDEPVIIPLGLLKYNVAKFSLAVFLGKIIITTPGAYLGQFGEGVLSSLIAQEALVTLSIALTIAITILLLRVDITKTTQKIQKTITKQPHQRR